MKSERQNNGEGRPLWEGHRERLRRRMEWEGWDALKPYEMVELTLYHAVPRQDLSDVSRLLVDRFGSVGGVFSASREQLLEVPGMTATLAEWIGLTGELMRAYHDLHGRSDIRMEFFRDVRRFLKPRMGRQGDARAWALYVDFNFNLITFADLREAEAWWDGANARRMLAEAIGNGARYVFLVLWQEVAAGMSDVEAARLESIAETLRAADLDLVDCLLAGGGEIYSMNLHGRMNRIRAESGCMELHENYGKT